MTSIPYKSLHSPFQKKIKRVQSIFFKKTRIFAIQIGFKVMIQRIQTVYLFAVAILGAVLPFWVNLWSDAQGNEIFAQNEILISATFFVTAVLAIISIMLFKNRKNQFVLNRLNMILNLFLLGFFVYRSLSLSGESNISEKGIGMLIPVISIVFLVLANRAIKKDEDLVKSVDRLR
jgi:peptidoglycan/LPS O-acetylase OafA/YrhL